jgi:hypothetical protein
MRSSLASVGLGEIHDAEVRGLFERVRGAVPRPRSVVTYLYNFVRHYNALLAERGVAAPAEAKAVWDPRTLNATQEGAHVARLAWERMADTAGLRGQYRRRVGSSLANAVAVLVPALATVIQPDRRPRERGGAATCGQVRLLALRSAAAREFCVEECLPLAVRRLGPGHPRYRALRRVGERLGTDVLRTVSKGHLQKVLGLLDRLHPGEAADPWDVWAGWDAAQWLHRYDTVTRTDPPISSGQLHRHLRTLHLLHHRLFRPGDPVVIPIRMAAASSPPDHPFEDDDDDDGIVTFGSTGSSDEDHHHRDEQQRLRRLVGSLRLGRCVPPSSSPEADAAVDRRYAFTSREIRAILLACNTTSERLVVLLLLTTGVRIGGLSRIRLPSHLSPPAAAETVRGRDIPRTLSTTEKNAATRVVVLTGAVRILVARRLRERSLLGGSGSPHGYLFPGKGDGRRPSSTHALWNLCRGVFRRAGVRGPHVHPHTFRHTLVHLMHIGGTTFTALG